MGLYSMTVLVLLVHVLCRTRPKDHGWLREKHSKLQKVEGYPKNTLMKLCDHP